MGSQTFDDIMEWGRLKIEGKDIVKPKNLRIVQI